MYRLIDIAKDVALLLSYYKSKLSLLLTVSLSRAGAASLMNAGIFSAVRGSGLFSTDPDLGLGMLFVLLVKSGLLTMKRNG